MPEGAVPDNQLILDIVFHRAGELGAFAPRMEDVSRVGLDNMVFVEAGSRGDRVTVQARHYCADEAEAQNHVAATEGLQGRELQLQSTIDGYSWMVFLHTVRSGIRPIGAATVPIGDGVRLCTAVIVYQLDVQRTY
jgi:hypothetical protein